MLYLPFEFYSKHLRNIDNISFTDREIDVIAGILHSKSASKISQYLHLSVNNIEKRISKNNSKKFTSYHMSIKTIESYISKINEKVRAHRCRDIRTFVEYTGTFDSFRSHYKYLLLEDCFLKQLEKISVLIKNKSYTCNIVLDDSIPEKDQLFKMIILHLKFVGINFSINELDSFNNTVILTNNNISTEVSSNVKEEDNINIQFIESYYHLIFIILEKVLKQENIQKIFDEFLQIYDTNKSRKTVIYDIPVLQNDKKTLSIKPPALIGIYLFIIFFLVTTIFFYLSFKNNDIKNLSVATNSSDSNFFNIRYAISSFVGREEILEEIRKNFLQNTGQIQVIGGIGGIGKTQTALTYANKYAQNYDYMIRWINAENDITLIESLRKFAQVLKINTDKLDNNKVIEEVKSKIALHSKKMLLIFDNANSFEQIQKYLPDNTVFNHRHDIIVTTRNIRKWDNVVPILGAKIIHLKPFNDSEAYELVKAFLPDVSQNDAQILAQTFDYIPLALSHPLAYIRNCEGMTIQKYLIEYETRKKQFDPKMYELFYSEFDPHKENIYLTILMTINKLSNPEVKDDTTALKIKAIKILELASYLNSEMIPIGLFSKSFKDFGEEEKILAILKGYSLISTKKDNQNNSYMYMHKLLQDIIIINNNQKQEEYIKDIAELVHNAMCYDYSEIENILNNAQPLLPHAISLINHLKNIKLSDDLKILLANLHFDCAQVFEKQAQFETALAEYQKSFFIKKEIYKNDPIKFISSLEHIALIYKALGSYTEALIKYEEILSIRKTTYGQIHKEVAQSLNNIGILYKTTGEYKKALDYYTKSLEIIRKLSNNNPLDLAQILNNIGVLYKILGSHEKALQSLEESLLIAKNGENSKKQRYIANALNNIGDVYKDLNLYSEAYDKYEKALVIRKKIYKSNHPEIGVSLKNIGDIYKFRGQYVEAQDKYTEALQLSIHAYGEKHPLVSTNLNNLGTIFEIKKEYNKALDFYIKALSIRQQLYDGKHPDIVSSLNNISNVYKILGNKEKSIIFAKEALDLGQKFFDNHEHKEIQKSLKLISQ